MRKFRTGRYRSYSPSNYDGFRRRTHSTGVWVVYKNDKHVGYVNSSSEYYAKMDAEAKFGYGGITVSEIEE